MRSVACCRPLKKAKSLSFCLMRADALSLEQETLPCLPSAHLRGIHVACIANAQLRPRLSRQFGISVQAQNERISLSLIYRKKLVAAVKFMKMEELDIWLYRFLQLNIKNDMAIADHLSLGGFPVTLAKNGKSHLENRK